MGLRAHAPLVGSLGPSFGAGRCIFEGSGEGTGHLYTISGGLAWRPTLSRRMGFAAEAFVGVGISAGAARPEVGAALGLEFRPAPWFTVGPSLRFEHVLADAADSPGADLQVLSLALALGFAPGARERVAADQPAVTASFGSPLPAPVVNATAATTSADTDGDGVPDAEDPCTREPAGAHPDPRRPGCPDRDSDADGLTDAMDHCVFQPVGAEGDPARPGCPVGDADGDGIADPRDLCRSEAQGVFADPTRPGCPMPDRDHDLVLDDRDTCPETAGAPNADPALNGCPSVVRIEGRRVRLTVPLVFEEGRLRRQSSSTLRVLRDALRASPAIVRVLILGRADEVPAGDDRSRLARDRAESLRRWLVEHDLDERRLDAVHEAPPSIPAERDPVCASSVELWLLF